MKLGRWSLLVTVLAFTATALQATPASLSFTGSLASSSSAFTLTFHVGGAGGQTIDVQTWGFGGGTNAAGNAISPGGFDPFLALFAGIGSGATILTDGLGNPFGTSDALSNFGTFQGCGSAGTVSVGGPVCGDISMSLVLLPGTYTLVLSDANFFANAVFDNGTLGEGFTDFTGGVFQTCNTVGSTTTCANDTANWAFDITDQTGANLSTGPTPEPGTLLLLGSGLLGLGWRRRAGASKH
ncbi:MAG TPA: DVUA0089 family protein [Candidatus Acidoferrales bacterium]|nr:DVUA0089 family protein [Candidatus Acidoferrales bacterium]